MNDIIYSALKRAGWELITSAARQLNLDSSFISKRTGISQNRLEAFLANVDFPISGKEWERLAVILDISPAEWTKRAEDYSEVQVEAECRTDSQTIVLLGEFYSEAAKRILNCYSLAKA